MSRQSFAGCVCPAPCRSGPRLHWSCAGRKLPQNREEINELLLTNLLCQLRLKGKHFPLADFDDRKAFAAQINKPTSAEMGCGSPDITLPLQLAENIVHGLLGLVRAQSKLTGPRAFGKGIREHRQVSSRELGVAPIRQPGEQPSARHHETESQERPDIRRLVVTSAIHSRNPLTELTVKEKSVLTSRSKKYLLRCDRAVQDEILGQTETNTLKLPGHTRYDHINIGQRKDYDWPGGKRLAFYIACNVEHFAFGTGLGADPAHRPGQNTRNYAWRDYGNRIGQWRLFELLDELKLPASILLNSSVCYHYPDIIERIKQRRR